MGSAILLRQDNRSAAGPVGGCRKKVISEKKNPQAVNRLRVSS